MHIVKSSSKINYYLKKHQIETLFSCSPVFELHHYLPGELIASPFEPCCYLQFIVEGEILLYEMPTESTFSMVQSPYYSAFMIGEIELLDLDFQTAFIEAKGEVYTLALPHEKYRDALLNDCVFLRTVCLSLSSKLNNAVRTSEKLPIREQLLRYFSIADPDKPLRDIAQFSHMMHISTRQLIRTLNRLCEEGYLEHPKKGVYLITEKARSRGSTTVTDRKDPQA